MLILGFIEPPHLTQFRFKRDIMYLAAKNPYWDCKKVGEEVHMKLLNAQLARPEGAVYTVQYVWEKSKFMIF